MAVMEGVSDLMPTAVSASKPPGEPIAEPMVIDTKVETVHNGHNGATIESTTIQATIEPLQKTEDGDVTMDEDDAPQNGLLNAAELVTSAPAIADAIVPPPQTVGTSETRTTGEILSAPANVEQPVSDVRDEEPLPTTLLKDEDSMAVDQPVETSAPEQNTDSVTLLPSKVEEAVSPAAPSVDTTTMAESSITTVTDPVLSLPSASAAPVDATIGASIEELAPEAPTGQVRQRDEDDEAEPVAKRAKITPDAEAVVPSVEAAAPVQPTESIEPVEPVSSAGPAEPQESAIAADIAEPLAPPADGQQSTTETVVADTTVATDSATAQSATMAAPELPASGPSEFDKNPLTKSQTRYLLDSVRKAKKIKAAIPFLNAVDPVALNIPSYPTVVPNPMDLGTIEDKLKNEKYGSANELWGDFQLMATNALAFNGPNHPVTQHGYNLRAYFNKLMQSIPKGDAAASEAPKKQAVSPKPMLPRRESRHVAPPKPSPTPTPKSAPKPAAAKSKAEPKKHEPVLDSNGVPVIRRASESERPKREIIKPQPKDMPYSHIKPKKKSAQLELKFCEQVVLKEIKKPKNQVFAYPFMQPVDVVALNIPTYHQVIKKPMDFGTIERNLQKGEYNNAKEFAADARLVFKNCFQFNGPNEPVHLWGKQVEALFEELFEQKDEWIAANQPVSEPVSDEESEEEESEDEPETQEERSRKIAELQKQIADLTAEVMKLMSTPLNTKSKKKSGGKSKSKSDPSKSKKRSSVGAGATPAGKASKPKKAAKPKKLTLEQKRYVSEGIMMLDEVSMRKAVQMIRNGVPKLKDVNDDELELDVDEIPDNVLQTLHKFVKDYRRANGTDAAEDDDYEDPTADDGPSAGGAGGASAKSGSSHRKKSKPMSAREQERSIAQVRQQLQAFDDKSGSEQAGNDDGDSSEDASSSSEEE